MLSGLTFRPILKGQADWDFLPLAERTDRLSWNVGI